MNEMIERGTKAILEVSDRYCFPVDAAIAELFTTAVIEALRVPTSAMLEAGPGEPYMDNYVWSKMIDEALK